MWPGGRHAAAVLAGHAAVRQRGRRSGAAAAGGGAHMGRARRRKRRRDIWAQRRQVCVLQQRVQDGQLALQQALPWSAVGFRQLLTHVLPFLLQSQIAALLLPGAQHAHALQRVRRRPRVLVVLVLQRRQQVLGGR